MKTKICFGLALVLVLTMTLGKPASAQEWSITGNAGTDPATNFLGTTDNQPLEIRVNNERVLRLEDQAVSPNLIGGIQENTVTPGVVGATIGGGGRRQDEISPNPEPNRVTGDFGTVSGGQGNQAGSDFGATIGGGSSNTASGNQATVSGGRNNTASGFLSTIGGGSFSNASAFDATVGGGSSNTANEQFTTISGGAGNTASGILSTIAGGAINTASGTRATVSGGVSNTARIDDATVGGGSNNNASGTGATVSGGRDNTANRIVATVSGGASNTASGSYSTVAGGRNNTAREPAVTDPGGPPRDFSGATVSGGISNDAAGNGATIPGGTNNSAVDSFTFAAGRRAKAFNRGSFVWGDSTNRDIASNFNDQFTARASGGVRFFSNGRATVGVQLAPGAGSWSSLSSHNAKTNFVPVDGQSILSRLATVPIQTWNYKSQDPSIRHIGSMAEDLYKAFSVGEDNKYINTVDADGIALASIQGLYQIVQEKDEQIATQQQKIESLEVAVKRLEKAINNKSNQNIP